MELLFETTPKSHPSLMAHYNSSTISSSTAATTTAAATAASSYSYNELRKAYLQKLQQIHPDKVAAASAAAHLDARADGNGCATAGAVDAATSPDDKKDVQTLRHLNDAKVQFQQLQSVWEQYQELAKDMQKVGKKGRKNGAGDDSNDSDFEMADFTQFGVGCSFSDTEQERQLRWEIQDQACRGWFSSGLLAEQTSKAANNGGDDDSADANAKAVVQCSISLLDDDMFSITDATMTTNANDERRHDSRGRNQHQQRRRQKTLIPGIS